MKLKKGIPVIDQGNKLGFWGGKFGGNFVPETLKKPIEDLEILFNKLKKDKKFIAERAEEIKSKYKIKIISALTISEETEVLKYKNYLEISDIILFDAKGYHKSESFDHNLLNEVPNELNKMIAGNIQIEDISSFKNKNFMIDLSGALEDENGKKDISKINKLLNLSAKI